MSCHPGGGGGVGEMTHKMLQRGRGVQKSVTYYLNGPFHRLPLDDGPGLGEAGDEIGFNGNDFFAEQVQNFDAA